MKLFDDISLTEYNCFLCGELLIDCSTVEHVFPKWLLKRFDLWNERLTLLNTTKIPYKNLVIPCCAKCNNNSLSQLEKRIELAFLDGYETMKRLDKLDVFRWMMKIMYGLLYRELTLLRERANSSSGYIITPDELKKWRMLRVFLQSIRLPFIFHNDIPASVFIFKLHELHSDNNYFYNDTPATLCSMVRMGEVGIIVCAEDNGMLSDVFFDLYSALETIALHPIQFYEFFAQVTYLRYLMNRTPKYLFTGHHLADHPVEVVAMPMKGLSEKPIFDEWDPNYYAKIFEMILNKGGYNIDSGVRCQDMACSTLVDENNKIVLMDKYQNIVGKKAWKK